MGTGHDDAEQHAESRVSTCAHTHSIRRVDIDEGTRRGRGKGAQGSVRNALRSKYMLLH